MQRIVHRKRLVSPGNAKNVDKIIIVRMAGNVIRQLDVHVMMDLTDRFVSMDVLMSQMGTRAMTVESMIITVTTPGIGMMNFGGFAREHVKLAVVLHFNAR